MEFRQGQEVLGLYIRPSDPVAVHNALADAEELLAERLCQTASMLWASTFLAGFCQSVSSLILHLTLDDGE